MHCISAGEDVDGGGECVHAVLLPSSYCLGQLVIYRLLLIVEFIFLLLDIFNGKRAKLFCNFC